MAFISAGERANVRVSLKAWSAASSTSMSIVSTSAEAPPTKTGLFSGMP